MSVLLTLIIAATPVARWEWSAPGLEASCPSSDTVAQKVSSRLGHVPFTDKASRAVHVSVTKPGTQFVAHIDVREPNGAISGRRITAPSCEDLADSVALVVVLAFDPLNAPPSAAIVETPPPLPVTPPPAPPKATSLRAEIWLGAHASLGTSPSFAAGGRVGAALRIGEHASFGIEGRFEMSPSLTSAFGSFAPRTGLGLALGCGHWKAVEGCLAAGGGALVLTGSRIEEQSATVPVFVGGARVGTFVELTRSFGLRFALEGLVPFNRPHVVAGSTTLWVAPPVSGSVFAAAVWSP